MDIRNKLKNTKLEEIKKLIDLTAIRSASKVGIDWLIKNKIESVADLLDKNKLYGLLPGYIPKEEFIALALADIKALIEKDRSYSTDIIEQMKKQHQYTWEMLLGEELYILNEERHLPYPRIWWKRLLDSCASDEENKHLKKHHIKVIPSYVLDYTYKEGKFEQEYCFELIELKYNDLIPFIKEYLIVLPPYTKVKESWISRGYRFIKLTEFPLK